MAQKTPEYSHVKMPTVQQLISMDWQYIEGDWDNAKVTERENFKQVLLTEHLKAAIKRINLDDNSNP
ncbi:hypothetical protein I8748_16395 [Nostoc sp. CENA67]|uniref:Uncharacterized protein n=1 Tax=Amazonocrinis nigriterrae CENA67 TaxID=2794033 RepID=A0A8J7LBJ4_9NOST|nr:hypothetical protein [Amazonocrinis nigriterrae]MBH8563751.1 hypothetical protein [Amazonocrinis nigriterrae CENA67]